MSKGTLKGLSLVLGCLLVGALILTFTNMAMAEERPPSCTSAITDNTLITQCNDGTVTVVNQATNTVMVCNSARSSDGTPKCTTQSLVRPN